jgi:hypothetical protein
MADNTDNLSMDSFGIQDTMEMGLGNATLLNDLYDDDTASGQSKDLTPIVKEVDADKKEEVKTVTPVNKSIDLENKEDTEESAQDRLKSFLSSSEDDDEDEPGKTKLPSDKNKENLLGKSNEEALNKSSNQFTALANDLYNLGVFTRNEGEEDDDNPVSSPEEFLERFQEEKRKGARETVDTFLGQFGDDYRNAFDAIYVKGVDPKEYFSVYNQVVDFSQIDLSEEINQEKVMKQALTDQGFDREDIDSEIERLKNYGDLASVAEKHHRVLVKKDVKKLEEMETVSQQKLQQKAFIKNEYVKNVQNVLNEKLKTKEFDGIPLNPKIAGELQDFLLTDKWKTPTGETLTDFDRTILDLKKPENHAMKVKVALLLKVLEKDPNLTSIQKTGVSKKTDSLFAEVARQATKKSVLPDNNSNSNDDRKWSL